MTSNIFRGISDLIRVTSPITIISNIILGVVLLVVGVVLLLNKQQQTKGKRIAGWICIAVSIMTFLGSVLNMILFKIAI